MGWRRCLAFSLVWTIALTGAPAPAAIITVGPDGTHADLQSAVTTALGMPGADELRVQSGTINGTTLIIGNLAANDLSISGGWDASFASQGAATVLDALSAGRVLSAQLTGGNLLLTRMQMRGGNSVAQAATLMLSLSGTASAIVGELSLSDSTSSATDGGCVQISAGDDSFVSFYDSEIRNCTNTHSTVAFGVGLKVLSQQRAQVILDHLSLSSLLAQGLSQAEGTAVNLIGQGQGRISGRQIAIHSTSTDAAAVFGTALAASASANSLISLTRLDLRDNLAPAAAMSSSQLAISVDDQASVSVSSSLIHSGPQSGITITGSSSLALADLSNLTVVNHSSRALHVFGSPSVAVHNTIFEDNGIPSSLAATSASHNLGSDLGLASPTFRGANDYRLAQGSAGIDAGTTLVPSGLAVEDLPGSDRVQGLTVDIGAYEFTPDQILRNGFESAGLAP
ncbi:MAG: choice-of-anchor Q domain-containing protein [Lysobacterales bacterium]